MPIPTGHVQGTCRRCGGPLYRGKCLTPSLHPKGGG
jgi:hypothetical protein